MMKLLLFLHALAIGSLASKIELDDREVTALLGRDIDPKTMNPTRLSVLSVLRTAIPSGPDAPLPTGDFEPEWYRQLPADVKSLLPSLYPAATIAPTTDGLTSTHVVSPTPVPSGAASLATPSLLLPISTVLVSSALANIGSHPPTPTAGTNSTTPWASDSPNGTHSIAAPSPSEFFSTGTKTAIKMEMFAAIMWVGVGMGFFIFA